MPVRRPSPGRFRRSLPTGPVAAPSVFELRISGTAGVPFQGRCFWPNGAAGGEMELQGTIPGSFSVEAFAIACTVDRADPAAELVVEVWKDGRLLSRSRSLTGGGPVRLSVR